MDGFSVWMFEGFSECWKAAIVHLDPPGSPGDTTDLHFVGGAHLVKLFKVGRRSIQTTSLIFRYQVSTLKFILLNFYIIYNLQCLEFRYDIELHDIYMSTWC